MAYWIHQVPLIRARSTCHIARKAFRNRVHQAGVLSLLAYYVSCRLYSRMGGNDKNVSLLLKTVILRTAYVET
jgi:hypothetical protein